ncbi:MAG: metallophosphoesterase [Myxococcales bacterium]|nr:metallophosphoesterase [Myxococcales bacterium]
MARARPPAVSILHLSDIHRTVDERVENEELLGGLKSDLEAHAADGVPRPQLVVVSGDLTQSAEPREYAQALQFLDKLAAHLALPRARVVVVPGNHDVHWPSSEEAFYLRRSRPAKSLEDLVIELDGRFLCAQGEGPYQRRLANFRDFYRAFTGDPYPEARAGQFTIHTFDELGVAIAGLNSCDLVDHERFRGRIHPTAIADAADQLAGYPGYRLAVWHHDLNWRQDPDADALAADSLRQVSQRTFNLALCGHTHRPAANDAAAIQGLSLPVVAAGSLCAGPRQRGESVPRSYNIIELRDETARVFVRVKDERHTPWRPDARYRAADGAFRHFYDLTMPRVAPQRAGPAPTPHDVNAPNPFQEAGTLPPTASSYVPRACDRELQEALTRHPLISVFGTFQSGKSSLLVRARSPDAHASARTCYLDLQRLRTDHISTFYTRFFELLSRHLGAAIHDWYDLEDAAAKGPLALLLDEVGHLTQPLAQRFMPELYNFAINHAGKVRVVVSAPGDIASVVAGWQLNDPKLMTGWHPIQIGPLDDAGIDRLLGLLPARAAAVARTQRSVIAGRSAGWPIRIQRLCSRLFTDAARGADEAALLARVASEESYL